MPCVCISTETNISIFLLGITNRRLSFSNYTTCLKVVWYVRCCQTADVLRDQEVYADLAWMLCGSMQSRWNHYLRPRAAVRGTTEPDGCGPIESLSIRRAVSACRQKSQEPSLKRKLISLTSCPCHCMKQHIADNVFTQYASVQLLAGPWTKPISNETRWFTNMRISNTFREILNEK